MIVFGIREKEHAGGEVINALCKNCGHRHHVSFGISRYLHLFWIPLLMTSRKVGLLCSNCKRITMGGDIPHEIKQQERGKVFTGFRLVPLYSGSVLLIVLMSLVYFAHLDNEKDEWEQIQNPMVNDVYSADLSAVFPDHSFGEYKYGAMRILSVADEGILLNISKEGFNDILSLTKSIALNSKIDEYFGSKTLLLSKDDVINLHEVEIIRSVFRNKKPSKNSKPIKW